MTEQEIVDKLERANKQLEDVILTPPEDVFDGLWDLREILLTLQFQLEEETDEPDKVSDCCGAELYEPDGFLRCKSCGKPCDAVPPLKDEDLPDPDLDNAVDYEPDKPDIKSDCCEAPVKEDIETKGLLGHEVHQAILYCTGCGDKCGMKTKDVDTDRMKEIFDKKRELDKPDKIEPVECNPHYATSGRNQEKINELVEKFNELIKKD